MGLGTTGLQAAHLVRQKTSTTVGIYNGSTQIGQFDSSGNLSIGGEVTVLETF